MSTTQGRANDLDTRPRPLAGPEQTPQVSVHQICHDRSNNDDSAQSQPAQRVCNSHFLTERGPTSPPADQLIRSKPLQSRVNARRRTRAHVLDEMRTQDLYLHHFATLRE